MRWILSLGAAAGLLGCPGGGTTTVKPDPKPPLPSPEVKLDLPAIPSKIDVTRSKPTDGNSPDKRSPLLDILKAETEREMGALAKQSEPAYYLAYQLVEQRLVNLEAEGGALITDERRHRAQPRRRGPGRRSEARQHPQPRQRGQRPQRAADPPRRGAVRRRQGRRSPNALWLETDRRYREAVTALGYVRQDQATLSKRDAAVRTSRPTKPEVYVETPAMLQFDKAQWVDRLKRCSAKALKGAATRGTCGVVFQLNTA